MSDNMQVRPYPLMIPTPDQCRIARAGLGWTQENLADASGLAIETIKHFENNKDIRLGSAVKIAGAFMNEDVCFLPLEGIKSFNDIGITVSIKK